MSNRSHLQGQANEMGTGTVLVRVMGSESVRQGFKSSILVLSLIGYVFSGNLFNKLYFSYF